MQDIARLFIGLELNDQARKTLDVFRRELLSTVTGKLTPPSLYHLTLCFLGQTPRERIPDLCALIDQVKKQPFPLSLGELGTFKNGSILWIGIEEPSPQLYELQRSLSGALDMAGFRVEKGAYAPHITLGRQVKLPKKLPGPPKASFQVTGVTLFESTRSDGRLVYLPLYRSWEAI